MMTRKFVSAALLLSLTWPLTGAGEERTQPQSANAQAQPQPANTEAQPQPANAQAQSQSADTEAQPQPTKVEEAHGDWALQCPENAPCFLIQRVFLKDDKEKPLISAVLQFSDKPSRLLLAIRTSLEVLLTPPGVEFGVDEVKATTHPFHHCRPEGCLDIFPVSKKLRKNLELGKQANIGYHLTNGKKYRIPVSLTGVTTGLQALKNTAKGAKNGASRLPVASR